MRASGILMHISSLPSRYGIGDLGKGAYDFVDFLKKSGQTYWQILPLCPTSFGDSPYQSACVFAGNPYFIDLDKLCEDGYLKKEEIDLFDFSDCQTSVDYGRVYNSRRELFKTALMRFKQNKPSDFSSFCSENGFWLDDFALFSGIKDVYHLSHLTDFPNELKQRQNQAMEHFKSENADAVLLYKMQQYFFFSQWQKLKTYANKNGVKIIGDEPIYASYDSADVWANRKNFSVDENLNLLFAAGCPPDSFSPNGQCWGNPVYNFDFMKEDGYSWYSKRIYFALKKYDVIRLDHFRAFDGFYKIPKPFDCAEKGEWQKGPGMDIFASLSKRFGKLPIIAEDLGFLSDSVKMLLKNTGFPGMKILQFAFDSREESDYLPHNYPFNCVAYTGTHDNDTVLGWEKSADKKDVEFAKRYLRCSENLAGAMNLALLSSTADTAILTAQDLLHLGSESRMNTPSTVGKNWKWRAKSGDFSDCLAERLHSYTKLYFRLSGKENT